ncbi:MAG TPA: hypothetical protein VK174_04590 [Chitinophagales bacterium]|nr:hypothetical protein [Chitinophagales bacterium]
MKLRFTPEAENVLVEIGVWVEERNTPGSGSRFIDKFIDKVSTYALPKAKYLLCRNEILASLQLSCIAINDWVVAFKCTNNEFVVYYILYGPAMK